MIFLVNPIKAKLDRWGRIALVETADGTPGAQVWNVFAFTDDQRPVRLKHSSLMKTDSRRDFGSGIVIQAQ